MVNDQDLQARQISRQVRPAGNPRLASTGGTSAMPTASSSRLVDGQVKRLWLIGDPWTADYYFENQS